MNYYTIYKVFDRMILRKWEILRFKMKSLVEFTLYLHSCNEAFALTGRKADCAYTQGVTLG